MSKRVYAFWFNGERISRIFLDRPETGEQLVNADFMQKDISEEEYATLAMDYKSSTLDKKPLPLFPLLPLSQRTAGCYEGWTDCTDCPEIPKRGSR